MADEPKKSVQGEDVVLLVASKAMAHATSHSFNSDLEIKDLLTKDTDGKEKSPGNLNWSIEAEAMVIIDPALTERHDMDSIFDFHLKKEPVECIIKSKDTLGLKPYIGKAFITKFSNTTKAGEDVTYSISLTGSGTLKPYTPPAPAMLKTSAKTTEEK